MRIIYVFILCLCSITLAAQLSGDGPRIRYYVEVDGVDWDIWAGENVPEGTWRVRTKFGSQFSTNSASEADYVGTPCITNQSYAFREGVGVELRSGIGPFNTTVYYNVLAYENDEAAWCTLHGGDSFVHSGRGTIDFSNRTAAQSTFHTYPWHNIQVRDWSDIRIRQLWSLYDGQWWISDGLAFGSLEEGDDVSHSNTTSFTEYKGVRYGSSNTFTQDLNNVFGAPAQEANDAYYRFDLSTAKDVSIATSATSFNHYIHLMNKKDGVFTHVASANGSNPVIDESLPAGVYYIIFEGEGILYGNFAVHVAVDSADISAGEITHPSPFFKEGCSLVTPISTSTPATNSFGGIFSYTWESKKTNEDNWQTITDATNETLTDEDLGTVTEDIDIRRIAHSEGLTATSNTISFEVKTRGNAGYNGAISGRVTGPNGIGNISGVKIYAISNAEGECQGHIDSTVTEGGIYTLDNLYYEDNGEGADFKVFATFLDHEFEPDTLTVNVASNNERRDRDFIDLTSLFIHGRLYQVDDNLDTCGVANTDILSTNQVNVMSDENGEYSMLIINRSFNNRYDITPSNQLYEWTPPNQEDIFAQSDVEGIDFETEQRDTISGAVTACGGFYFGKVLMKIEDLSGCFSYLQETDENGNFEIVVPSRKYIASVVNVVEVIPPFQAGIIENYFVNVIDTLDVTTSADSFSFIYHQAPEIEIEGLPLKCSSDIVFNQGEPVDLTFYITEANTGGCSLDTGLFIIEDGISDRAPITLPISQGIVHYTVLPGEPNIFATTGYSKNFTVTAEDLIDSDLSTQLSFDAIVEGNKPRQSTFTTVSPELPMLILRDPPGDKSYSFVEEGQTTDFGFNISMRRGGSVEVATKIKTSPTIITGVGVLTEQVTIGDFETEFKLSAYSASSTDQVWSITTNREYRTSDDEASIGEDADVFVTASMVLIYGLTDIITYNEQTCTIDESIDLIMGADSINSIAVRSQGSIENDVIPTLIQQRDALSESDSTRYLVERQIEVWRQLVERNEELKTNAIPSSIGNINWDGGVGGITDQRTESHTSSFAISAGIDIEKSIAAAVGFSIAGIGLENTVTVGTTINIGGGVTGSTTNQRTVGFVLDDDDITDKYATTVLMDTVYGTPVFQEIGGATSCPYTEGSLIDNAVLSVDVPSQIDVPFGDTAFFRFTITNASELPDSSSNSTRTYYLDIDQNSNTESAGVQAGGNSSFPIKFTNIPRGQAVSRLVGITRPLDNTFTIEGLRFTVSGECNNDPADILDDQEVSVFFISQCSNINMNAPVEGWLINEETNNSIDIHITDYDKSLTTSVALQYTRAGVNSWTQGPEVSVDELNNNSVAGTFLNWNTTEVPDGIYEVRLKLVCSNGIIYTPRVAGRIDRTAPIVFGVPSPVDDRYEQSNNDRIYAAFSEALDCSSGSAVLMNMETDEEYAANLTCSSNEAEIVPADILDNFAPAAYRVILSGIEDLSGNASDTHRWAFIVGDYLFDPDCSPIDISNNNINQDAISQSVYRAMTINSDGTVVDGTQIGYRASESVSLESGFTVNEGGILEASIEVCED